MKAELHRWDEIIQDAAPVALVIGPATVAALVDNDEIKKSLVGHTRRSRVRDARPWAAHSLNVCEKW